jgi:hypothetical protein
VQTPPQQGCPAPPQPAHIPLVHIPKLFPQVIMLATQALATQQPPALQALLAQQGSPGPPQAAQVPPPPPAHTFIGSLHMRPGQQA